MNWSAKRPTKSASTASASRLTWARNGAKSLVFSGGQIFCTIWPPPSSNTRWKPAARRRRGAPRIPRGPLVVPPADLAADLLEVHLGAVDHVLADLGERTGERREHADLDGAGLRGRPGRRQER